MKQKRRHIAGMLCAAIAASLFASPVSLEAKSGIDVYRLYTATQANISIRPVRRKKTFLQTEDGTMRESAGLARMPEIPSIASTIPTRAAAIITTP